ncbi:MAG: prepilin-type N-terminal cleavage/methylation domain-containing protein [Planctomycetaceae bacterium]|nr:prepilin-type N-terminal cleavage/methylation domain-containing protein [Planctomycetaceae bacterium]
MVFPRFIKKAGFTLIELLVVISIIAILISILVPSLGRSREQSRQVVCGTNLHSIGQGLFVYAHDHDDLLVPGDYHVAWAAYAQEARNRVVNLGYLMSSDVLPVPSNEGSVFFCPSMKPAVTRQTSGQVYFDYDSFQNCWQKSGVAPVDYIYNTALDGFGNSIFAGTWPIMSHRDRVQYLMADGSIHTFKLTPLVFDPAIGPELLQDVCARRCVNFPSLLLHQWFVRDAINIDEANAYLADPAGWMTQHATSLVEETASRTRLSQVASVSVASDIVGVWESRASAPG